MKMAVLRGGKDCDRQEKENNTSLCRGGVIEPRLSIFGKFADLEMLSWIRRLALDPCNSGISMAKIRPLWNQTLKVRKIMELSDKECPQRKRKLHQFLKEKFPNARGLASEMSVQQNVTKLSRGHLSHASSVSCLLNMVDHNESFNQKIVSNSRSSGSLLTFEDNLPENAVPSEFSFLDKVSHWSVPNENISPSADSDESFSGSNPSSRETLFDSPSLDFDDSVHSSNTSSSKELKQMNAQAPRRSIRLLNFIGDHLQRMVIPVGPRFQADVPDWTGPVNMGKLNGGNADSENLRWLGIRIWPMEGTSTGIDAGAVGKGRPDSCSCVSPGSTDCIKHHISEERLRLQSDLGPAFLCWKFDEMGEEVSEAWTLKEQKNFESLMKKYPPSNGKNFLQNALKCFPSKSKERIISYFFNVFIPRRISLQTKKFVKQIDSDDDEAEDVNCTYLQEKCNGRSTIRGNSKDLKTRYLRGRS
ncbi:uncharacterized protein LOC132313249 [Cornus florida]|uniref:uncharacterized protein LOC132313249 n=1 Tax=Cornus florida TaxID=4283 RepID=UPI00289A701F|nr:uncharacterized protein LOC132313249 [Cornus florida]XP_059667925.1 uncharacterized protein LOC132313249 [Cornus florida]XP_059667926.1 uncharacterized protein LOC132313249 [Cornus florida]XP_059667927.1 uncharacterized protein LOC132313249 [Cornus florida]XP_059667928.1 uncharacterized protein LOC132313249 [Cornus florida]